MKLIKRRKLNSTKKIQNSSPIEKTNKNEINSVNTNSNDVSSSSSSIEAISSISSKSEELPSKLWLKCLKYLPGDEFVSLFNFWR